MTVQLAPTIRQRFLDANANPLSSGKLYAYQAGTSTPQNTYTDASGGTPNANPVILSANGEANIWLDISLSYKFVLKDSSDVTQWTVDNVVGLLAVDTVTTASLQNDSVTAAKLRDDASVDANRAVTTNHIRDSAITIAKVSATTLSQSSLLNLGISAAVAGNALTISLKDASGADASATSPVKISFRSSTASDGTPVVRSVTSALSVVVSSGSTLGHVSAVDQYVYVWAIDNAGTVELAVSGSRYFDEATLQSTTAEGGAGAADSASTLYSTTARSNKAVRLLGRLKSNQSTAGTWATAIAEISLNPGRWPEQAPWKNDLTFTYAGLGTVSGNTVFYKRVGDSMHVRGHVTLGTTTATPPLINFPAGIAIDPSKITSTANVQSVGYAHALPSGGTAQDIWAGGSTLPANAVGLSVFYDGSTTGSVQIAYLVTGSAATIKSSNANAMFVSGWVLEFSFEVPVAAWASY